MLYKSALRLAMLVLFTAPAISIDVKFWNYFYNKVVVKSPLENLRSLDRDNFKANLDAARDNLLVLSDTISEVVASKDRMEMNGGETIKSISTVLEFNDYTLGIKDDVDTVNDTNSSSAAGLTALMNRNDSNSTSDKTSIGTVTKKLSGKSGRSNKRSTNGHLEEIVQREIENSKVEKKQFWAHKVMNWITDKVNDCGHMLSSYTETNRAKKNKEFLEKLGAKRINMELEAHSQAIFGKNAGHLETNTTANESLPEKPPNSQFSAGAVTRDTKAKIDTWAQYFNIEEKGTKALDSMIMNSVKMRQAGLDLIKVLRDIPPQF